MRADGAATTAQTESLLRAEMRWAGEMTLTRACDTGHQSGRHALARDVSPVLDVFQVLGGRSLRRAGLGITLVLKVPDGPSAGSQLQGALQSTPRLSDPGRGVGQRICAGHLPACMCGRRQAGIVVQFQLALWCEDRRTI